MDIKETLSEMFRDDDENVELLEAFGEDVPEDAGDIRRRVLEHVEGLTRTRILSTLFDHASGFVRMARDILAFCKENGVGIEGQIRVKTEGAFLNLGDLNSGWSFSGRSVLTADAGRRADALASELEHLAKKLDTGELVRHMTEVEEDLSAPMPDNPGLRSVYKNMFRKRSHFEAYTKEDQAAVRDLLVQVGEARSSLRGTPLGSGLASAFDELDSHGSALLGAMGQARLVAGDVSPGLAGMIDEAQLIVSLARSVAEDVAEAHRAEGGFRDFLRTDFWFQRWRIYEIWVLVRILKALGDAGGRVALRDVDKAVWNLEYSRANRPVASCTFDEVDLDVYYQYFRQRDGDAGMTDKSADMPDIAVFERERQTALIVIDPKHGKSFRLSSRGVLSTLTQAILGPILNLGKAAVKKRKTVDQVLISYARIFDADLTAVVNYSLMDENQYRFEEVRRGRHRWLLASGVSPGSVALRRLELSVTDVLFTRGYGLRSLADGGEGKEVARLNPGRKPAQAGHLLYLAGKGIEVDEPEGYWVVPEQGGPTPLRAQFGEVMGRSPRLIRATADGSACVISSEKGLVLLREKAGPEVLTKIEEVIPELGWNPQGTRLAGKRAGQIQFLDREGKERESLEFHTHGRLYSWAADEESILCLEFDQPMTRWTVYMSEGFQSWQTLHIGEPVVKYVRNIRFIPLGPKHGTILMLDEAGFIIGPGGVRPLDTTPGKRILAASPSGRYRLLDMGHGLREGVKLLAVDEPGDQVRDGPLIRLSAQVKEDAPIRWRSDESRVAFMAGSFQIHEKNYGPDETRLHLARIGDRHAAAVSLPGQMPSSQFAWLSQSLLKSFLNLTG
jgi:hypothetical protein